jgi:hypothetical protein
MEKVNKYFCVDSKTLAIALNYVGFSYFRFENKDNSNEKSYSFEDTEDFQEALTTLNKLRKKNNKYKK